MTSGISPLTPIWPALAAAVIGDETSPETLQSVLGLSDDEFRARLDAAEELGLLFEAKLFPARLCRFRHSLIREVVYRQMLSPQRRELPPVRSR